jgi:hypothetical protein
MNTRFIDETFDYRSSSLSIARIDHLATSLMLAPPSASLWRYSSTAAALTPLPGQ